MVVHPACCISAVYCVCGQNLQNHMTYAAEVNLAWLKVQLWVGWGQTQGHGSMQSNSYCLGQCLLTIRKLLHQKIAHEKFDFAWHENP